MNMITDNEVLDQARFGALARYVWMKRKEAGYQDHTADCAVVQEALAGASITNAVAKCNCLWRIVEGVLREEHLE